MAKPERKTKPGPEPDVLKIDGDPEEALRKLLTKQPESTAESEPEATEDADPEEG